jgi:ElaB/YqjD/DUF883 family membrane-anchored ribosome-binding protein
MRVPTLDLPALKDTVRQKVQEAEAQLTELGHEAERLKHAAADGVTRGVHSATGLARRGLRQAREVFDESTYRIKRHPLQAVGLALGAGLLAGWAVGRWGRRKSC